MTSIAFQPYVGPTYQGSRVRLLIVGESHYGDPAHAVPEFTQYVVEEWQSRGRVRYLTVAARILTGLKAWELDRGTAFAEIAFYNFVQVMMPDVSVRPTNDQARESWSAFHEVLERWDPTHIVVTGITFLWSNMPPAKAPECRVEIGGVNVAYREYVTPSGRARTIVVPHLSRTSAVPWQGPMVAFREMAAIV
jgi:hypothetical protein